MRRTRRQDLPDAQKSATGGRAYAPDVGMRPRFV
jgi:hypothetical protein